jgi:F-box-like
MRCCPSSWRIRRSTTGRYVPRATDKCGVLNDLDGTVVWSISQCAAIESLPNEVITKIFIFDRLISIPPPQIYWSPVQPWKWHRLAHVCRRWRYIIFDSPRSLNLQLFCTYGTPVKNNLDCWPALPIVMQYLWEPLTEVFQTSSEIGYQDDIMAALQNSDRICTLWLRVTTPLLEKLSTLPQKPFPVLEHLELGAGVDDELILPNESFVGPFPKLRVLHVVGIAFPALQRILPSARDLVELQLEALPSSGYITPAALLAFLPVMTCLETLSLDFRSPISRPISGGHGPVPQGRAVLLALEWFTFCGVSDDLECLLSGIDAPGIMGIDVTFFNQATIFDTSHFLQFISRTQTQRSHDAAHLFFSDYRDDSISMILSQRGRPLRMVLTVLCMPLDWQLSCMAEIFANLYPVVRDVRSFHIDKIPNISGKDDVDPSSWLELFRPFTNVEELLLPEHVALHVRYILEREGLLPNARVTVISTSSSPASSPPISRTSSRPISRTPSPPVSLHFTEEMSSFTSQPPPTESSKLSLFKFRQLTRRLLSQRQGRERKGKKMSSGEKKKRVRTRKQDRDV